jgi:tRNA(Ile)-lysidine synthase
VIPLVDRVDRTVARLALEPGSALVAVSGGPDSLALLDLLRQCPSVEGRLAAVIHVDHGIHPESGTVAGLVARAAERAGLPILIERLALGPGVSETRARAGRFGAFRRALAASGARFVFLGHSRDDQVETLLMRFLRGSGPAGMVGMTARRGPWLRPLLDVSRAELLAHARTLDPAPWQDPANQDSAHLRSWVRQRLVPLVKERFPDLDLELPRARRDFRDQLLAVDWLLARPELDLRSEIGGYSVAGATLQGYSSPVVRVLLRALGRRLDLRLGRAEVERLMSLLATGESGRRVDLGQGAVGELSGGRLSLFASLEHPPIEALDLIGAEGTGKFGRWTVRWSTGLAPDQLSRLGWETWVTLTGRYRARPWRAGDRVRPLGGRGSRLVVRCMQDLRVPRAHRPQWPVFEADGTTIWVPGVCRSDSRVPGPGSPAMRIDVGPG